MILFPCKLVKFVNLTPGNCLKNYFLLPINLANIKFEMLSKPIDMKNNSLAILA